MEELDITQIREKAHQMSNIETMLDNLETSVLDFKKKTSRKPDKETFDVILKVKFIHSKIKEKQLITERIQSLINNIGKMRAQYVTQDTREAKRTINKYADREDRLLKNMIKENKQFSQEIKELKESYDELKRKKIIKKKEYDKINNFLTRLRNIQRDQEKLIYSAGLHFVRISQKLLKLFQ